MIDAPLTGEAAPHACADTEQGTRSARQNVNAVAKWVLAVLAALALVAGVIVWQRGDHRMPPHCGRVGGSVIAC